MEGWELFCHRNRRERWGLSPMQPPFARNWSSLTQSGLSWRCCYHRLLAWQAGAELGRKGAFKPPGAWSGMPGPYCADGCVSCSFVLTVERRSYTFSCQSVWTRRFFTSFIKTMGTRARNGLPSWWARCVTGRGWPRISGTGVNGVSKQHIVRSRIWATYKLNRPIILTWLSWNWPRMGENKSWWWRMCFQNPDRVCQPKTR